MLKVDFIVNSIFDSITWLLSETECNQVWLVDCGDVEPIIEIIKGKNIIGVLLTHEYFDHIFGLPELLKHYPDCRIYTNENGRETLADAKLNMSFFHETPLIVNGPQITICGEGDVIQLFQNFTARVYETPGHHPSCITFCMDNYLFTGDAYIPGCKVVTNLPKGNKVKAQESLGRILNMSEGKMILSGHKINERDDLCIGF